METLWFLDCDLSWELMDLSLFFYFVFKHSSEPKRVQLTAQSFVSWLLPLWSVAAATWAWLGTSSQSTAGDTLINCDAAWKIIPSDAW